MYKDCVQRFSICKDVLTMIAEYLATRPYKEVVGMMNALQHDPKPMKDGKELEPPVMKVERPNGTVEGIRSEEAME